MPKRKRSANLPEVLETSRVAISQALKEAKGYERQRLNKRVRDDRAAPDKQERLQREIAVLKSLDLQHTARAHLYSSLLRIKSIAASTDLPDEVRRGVSKPDLSEQEKTSLHNVTTGLYNRVQVKQAVDRAIAAVCDALDLPVPEKGKKGKKATREEAGEQLQKEQSSPTTEKAQTKPQDDEWGDESDFQGFETDVDEPGPVIGEGGAETEAAEEDEFSRFDHLLGSSSDEEDDEMDEEMLERYRGKETVNLDDISISGSDLDSGEESDEEAESEEDSEPVAPVPAKTKKAVKEKTARSSTVTAGNSTFLPSLMNGYISGSESASDLDVAPPKKRRGQRQRQAIWEQKYGHSAKHLQKDAKRGGGGGGRDQGWDMRRGAVDGEDAGRRTPWKKGIQNPLASSHGSRGPQTTGANAQQPKRTKDNEGTLHPSWVAKQKAKEAAKSASFVGQKITFD